MCLDTVGAEKLLAATAQVRLILTVSLPATTIASRFTIIHAIPPLSFYPPTLHINRSHTRVPYELPLCEAGGSQGSPYRISSPVSLSHSTGLVASPLREQPRHKSG